MDIVSAKHKRHTFCIKSTLLTLGIVTLAFVALGWTVFTHTKNTQQNLVYIEPLLDCPAEYTYLAYEDVLKFNSTICSTVGDSVSYRISEGGCITCEDGVIVALKIDPRPLPRAYCVRTTVSDAELVQNSAL